MEISKFWRLLWLDYHPTDKGRSFSFILFPDFPTRRAKQINEHYEYNGLLRVDGAFSRSGINIRRVPNDRSQKFPEPYDDSKISGPIRGAKVLGNGKWAFIRYEDEDGSTGCFYIELKDMIDTLRSKGKWAR